MSYLGGYNTEKLTGAQREKLEGLLDTLETTMVEIREAVSTEVKRDETSGQVVEWDQFLTHKDLDDLVMSVWENSADLAWDD